MVGDVLVLELFDPTTNDYIMDVDASRVIRSFRCRLRRRVTYIMRGDRFGIEPGHVVMGLAEEQPPTSEHEQWQYLQR
jgi:hypothetical protein